jgi:hypothetical protein
MKPGALCIILSSRWKWLSSIGHLNFRLGLTATNLEQI